MRRVILESPYAANPESRLPAFVQRWLNRRYARRCVRDSLSRGEAPIASHLLYTQPGVLRDEIERERQWGIDAGLAWREVSEATVAYVDHNISMGMRYGIRAAVLTGKPVEFRAFLGRKHAAVEVEVSNLWPYMNGHCFPTPKEKAPVVPEPSLEKRAEVQAAL